MFRRLFSCRRSSRRLHAAVLCVLLFSVVVFNEFLDLTLRKALRWRIPNLGRDSVRVLVVADPQLLGYQNEHEWFGWLTRWDSDRLALFYKPGSALVNFSMHTVATSI